MATGIGIIDDLMRLFDNPDIFPKFYLYKQNDPNAVAVTFTDIKNNFDDTLEIELVHQSIENSQIINPYYKVKPRLITAEIVFLPYSIKGKLSDIMSQMEDVKNQAETYLLNRELVLIKREYPLVTQYQNLKITKLRKSTTMHSLNYMLYDITFEQVIGYNATNGQVKSNQANNPTNSSTVKTK